MIKDFENRNKDQLEQKADPRDTRKRSRESSRSPNKRANILRSSAKKGILKEPRKWNQKYEKKQERVSISRLGKNQEDEKSSEVE